jgi:hypothetical protein
MNDLLEKHSSMRLQIELVPNGCWYTNVRSNVSKKEWNIIRKKVYQAAGYHCEICGGKGNQHPVECHEVWEYNEFTGVQKLSFFQALCPLCHEVKHIGFARSRGFGNRALKTFCSVNEVTETEAESIINAVFDQWEYRSLKKWTLDISLLKEYGIEPKRY